MADAAVLPRKAEKPAACIHAGEGDQGLEGERSGRHVVDDAIGCTVAVVDNVEGHVEAPLLIIVKTAP